MRRDLILRVLILLFFLLQTEGIFPRKTDGQHQLTVVYIGDVQGEIEPCG